ncbi:DUF2490 domain-containing protein [Aquimarina longa]|uniref:DUF2490 domain-containing protein n=1 Tax=Aquimarina longa TaxID=1080221 RepID=UPI000784CE61|nr:DUF2490 domain-containing protein [Aquimarina longa]
MAQKSSFKYIAFFAFLLSIIHCKAQKADQFNSWWYYSGEYTINDKIMIRPLYAWSRNEFIKNWQQSKLSVGVHYIEIKNVRFGAGYEWIILFPYGAHPIPEKRTEHRIFESIEVKNKIGKVKVGYKAMLEQRIFKDKTTHRVRMKIGVKIPISQSEKINLLAFNSIFLNIGNVKNQNYFNQNRAFIGIETTLTKSTSFSLGYMNQYLVINPNRIENNHTLMVGLNHKFKL